MIASAKRIFCLAVVTSSILVTLGSDSFAQGSLMPTNPPGPTMYSLQQIYERTDVMSDGFAILTNALGEMCWSDVIDLGVACHAMTQDVHDLTAAFFAVNWGSVSNISTDMSILLDALGQMDWNDVIDLTEGCRAITQDVHTIGENVIFITNALCHTLGEMDWNDILALSAAISSVTQSIQYMEMTFATVDWAALGNFAYNWPIVTNALCGIDWNDIQAIEQSVSNLSNRLTNVESELDAIKAVVLENNALLHSLTNSP